MSPREVTTQNIVNFTTVKTPNFTNKAINSEKLYSVACSTLHRKTLEDARCLDAVDA
jgi:hypothetical protein